MKPIEEGCLALIIQTEAGNSGVVRVGKFLGFRAGSLDTDYWEVNRPMKFIWNESSSAPAQYSNREVNLMRIDGKEFEKDREQEKCKEHHEKT